MHHRALPIHASRRLLQEYDTGRGDEVDHHACIYREGTVDEQEHSAQEGRDHSTSGSER